MFTVALMGEQRVASLFQELKRRNVFRVGVAYVIVGWLIVQVIETISEPLGLPDQSVLPEQYVNSAGTAMRLARRHKSQYLIPSSQPVIHPGFQNRPAIAGAQTLAMNDAHAGVAAITALTDKLS